MKIGFRKDYYDLGLYYKILFQRSPVVRMFTVLEDDTLVVFEVPKEEYLQSLRRRIRREWNLGS